MTGKVALPPYHGEVCRSGGIPPSIVIPFTSGHLYASAANLHASATLQLSNTLHMGSVWASEPICVLKKREQINVPIRNRNKSCVVQHRVPPLLSPSMPDWPEGDGLKSAPAVHNCKLSRKSAAETNDASRGSLGSCVDQRKTFTLHFTYIWKCLWLLNVHSAGITAITFISWHQREEFKFIQFILRVAKQILWRK
jgi:hypothetical protein